MVTEKCVHNYLTKIIHIELMIKNNIGTILMVSVSLLILIAFIPPVLSQTLGIDALIEENLKGFNPSRGHLSFSEIIPLQNIQTSVEQTTSVSEIIP